jgi:hypothetical protein
MRIHPRATIITGVLGIGIIIGTLLNAAGPVCIGDLALAQPGSGKPGAPEKKSDAWYPRTEQLAAD